MFERFTDRARRVLVLAQEEARLLNHGFIGTEHILLGLIDEGEGLRPGCSPTWASRSRLHGKRLRRLLASRAVHR